SAAANAAVEDLKWATRLVNAQNPLPENFTVKTTAIRGYDNREFDHRAAQSLEALLHDAEQAGNKLYLVSAYRSIERQAALFKRKTAFYTAQGKCLQDAEKEAAKWVARPGTSEHNTGLAADIVSASWYENNSDLTQAFETTPEFAWLSAHCSEYGFILRYPKGKEDITGIAYEPWHYRYVGKNAAEKICKAELCLEEYFLQDA
ncbi:MAG: M15 family metallopeptidase, partial [Oscillospiraceae bacterium]